MGRAIVYCNQCGGRILPEDIEKGLAARVGDSQFCPACVAASPVKPATAPAAAKPPAPAAMRPRAAAVVRPRRSAVPIVAGAALLGLALAGLLLIPTGPAPASTSSPDPSPAASRPPAPGPEPPASPSPSPIAEPPPPPAPKPPRARPWHEIVDEAYSHYKAREYPKAKELYLQAMPLLPADPPKGPHEAWWHYAPYNLATIFAMESASLPAQARADAQAECRRWLAKALAAGYTRRRCRCHGSTLDHFKKDEKFAAVRPEPWFQELLASVAR